jgi:hypothetical protein
MRPKINIKYAKLLDPFLKEYVKVNYPTYQFPSEEIVLDKVSLFQKTWSETEDLFFNFIEQYTKLQFQRNVIDCFIVSAISRDMSSPLIIRSRYDETEFIDSLIHELLHILLVDNNVSRFKYNKEISERTSNHINIFALLSCFYLKALKDENRLEKIKEKADDNNPDYKKAWEIVEEIGFEKVLENLNN